MKADDIVETNVHNPEYEPDPEFVYDYFTLRVGGLAFAGIIVFLSVILLTCNKMRRCGKAKPRKVPMKDDDEDL
ncbi:hypothetical protein AALO_G00204450 [Alosa alosa]|uniref:FXYD domain-containing ion transport regulator n=1 Tax=Alosa alosa TaxID=278164 RepID=A0AAV6G6Y6_9TELE|nr:hypothetical protein AALO_G00204450 [Alosa alosa]